MIIQVDSTTPQRLDVFLVSQLTDHSRGQIQSLIKDGHILLNDKTAKAKQMVSEGDSIYIIIPEVQPNLPQPENIPLDILFEDDHLLVINKPTGLVVHPGAGNDSGTVVNAILHHCGQNLAFCAGDERPGIVHRLDKDTSGCLVIAKSDAAYHSLVSQFSGRTCDKRYLCVTQSALHTAADTVSTHIGRHPVQRQKMAVLDPPAGKAAVTDYKTLHADPDSNTCLVLCTLHTGRTHQIRIHMLHAGAPLIGDPIYSKPARQPVQTNRLMLHAWQLGIDHPTTQERMLFESPIPKEFHPWSQQADL